MNATILAHILDAAEGISGGKGRYEVADDHRVTFYLGRPGQAMEAREVSEIQVGEGFVGLQRREDDGTLYASLQAVAAVAVRRAKGDEGRRAGF